MSYKLLMAGVLFASACLNFGPSVALADTYHWSFNGGSANDYSGTLITGAAAGAGFDITSITGSGTINGSSVTITGPVNFALSDNILFPNASPQLDFFGVSFAVTGGQDVNVSCFTASIPPCFQLPQFGSPGGTFTATLVPGVPGPIAGAGLPGLILASGGLLGWWRRRQKIA